MIRRLFSAPRFDDMEQDFRAKFVNGFAWIAMILISTVAVVVAATGFTDYTLYVLIGLALVFAITIVMLKYRLLNLSSIMVVVLTWLGIFFQAYTAKHGFDARQHARRDHHRLYCDRTFCEHPHWLVGRRPDDSRQYSGCLVTCQP